MEENENISEKPQDAPESIRNKDVNFLSLFDPREPRSEVELQQARLEICKQCPWLNPIGMRCRQCGCFMTLKSTLRQAKCPLEKW